MVTVQCINCGLKQDREDIPIEWLRGMSIIDGLVQNPGGCGALSISCSCGSQRFYILSMSNNMPSPGYPQPGGDTSVSIDTLPVVLDPNTPIHCPNCGITLVLQQPGINPRYIPEPIEGSSISIDTLPVVMDPNMPIHCPNCGSTFVLRQPGSHTQQIYLPNIGPHSLTCSRCGAVNPKPIIGPSALKSGNRRMEISCSNCSCAFFKGLASEAWEKGIAELRIE